MDGPAAGVEEAGKAGKKAWGTNLGAAMAMATTTTTKPMSSWRLTILGNPNETH